MSSTSTTTKTSPTPASTQTRELLQPTTPAIPLLATPVARTLNHACAPAVLAYFALRFRALVADPLPTMAWDLVPLVLIQSAFCALALPSAGAWASGGRPIIEGTATGPTAGSGGSGGGKSRGRKPPALVKASSVAGSVPLKNKIMPTFFALVLTLTVPTLPLTALALLLGAPLYPQSLIPHTLLLSTHVSVLAVLPLFYTHGVSGAAWRDAIAAWLPFDEAGVWAGAVGALVGGWLGAVPMALDWDRDWQAWPVPVLTGVYLGWATGRLLTALLGLGIGRRIDLGC